jgi:hypothetical protein
MPNADNGNLYVVDPPFTVADIQPAVLPVGGSTPVPFQVDGSGFANEDTITFDTPGMTASNVTVVSPTEITGDVAMDGTVTPGWHTFTVTATDGSVQSCTDCAYVSDFPISTVTPTVGLDDPGQQSLQLTGTLPTGSNLVAELVPDPLVAGQNPIVSSTTTSQTATEWLGEIDLTDAAPGAYRPLLTDNAGHTASCTCLFTVAVEQAPSITNIAPGALAQGVNNAVLTVTGQHFPHGATITVDGSDITTSPTTAWINSTTLQTTVTVASTATLNRRTVHVVDPNQAGTGDCSSCLFIDPPPKLTGLSPGHGVQGRELSITVDGKHLNPGAQWNFGPGVQLIGESGGGTQLMLRLSVLRSAGTGARDVTITNPDGGTATLGQAFTVTSAPVVKHRTPAHRRVRRTRRR